MKYTVEGFLQEKLVALGLDMADALILRWFVDFAGTGNMRQLAYNHRIYYFVKYAGVIRDLPVLGISSTKGIGKRFEKYIEKGLLVKTVRRQGAGTLLYFAPTRHLLELQYHSTGDVSMKGTPVPFTESCGDNYIQNELDFSESEPPCPPERGEMAGNPPENAHSPATAETGGFLKGTPVPFVDVKGTPVAFRKEPQFPSERNSSSLALNNSSTRNSSTTDSLTTEYRDNALDKNSAAAVLKNEFGKRTGVEVFSPDFWEKTAAFLAAQNLGAESIPPYVEFLFDYAKKNNPRNLPHYLYKTAATSYMVAEFQSNQSTLQSQRQQESLPKRWHCICGTVVREDNCPECGLARRELGDERALIRAKERYRTLEAQPKKTDPG